MDHGTVLMYYVPSSEINVGPKLDSVSVYVVRSYGSSRIQFAMAIVCASLRYLV